MLKKMKAAADDPAAGVPKDLSKSVLDSSRQIWLAGLGAFSRAQQEGRKAFDTLVKQGYIKRGYLGISSQLVRLPDAQRAGQTQEHGLLIVKVDENSPAEKGGLMLGDILVALDGHTINDSEDLQILLTGDRVGKAIPVDVIRGNTLQTLQVTVGQRK